MWRYDNYDRRGPKVFAGEYACHPRGRKFNHFDASLLEAAFMTGLERNADIVHLRPKIVEMLAIGRRT